MQNNNKILRLSVCAMMTAIVFVGNFLRITIPISLGGVTSFTLANIFCALSGILLGPLGGFIAAGLGSGLYDLTNPAFVMEAPITFITKGMYGLVAGLVLWYVFRAKRKNYGPQLAATTCAAVAYMIVYLIKNYFYNAMLIAGLTEPAQCWAMVVTKIPATITNGVIAMVVAPILGVAVTKALESAHLDRLLEK